MAHLTHLQSDLLRSSTVLSFLFILLNMLMSERSVVEVKFSLELNGPLAGIEKSDAILAVGGSVGILALAAIRLRIRNVTFRTVRPRILRFGH